MMKMIHAFFLNHNMLCYVGIAKVDEQDVLEELQRARSSSLSHWLVKGRSAGVLAEAAETRVS